MTKKKRIRQGIWVVIILVVMFQILFDPLSGFDFGNPGGRGLLSPTISDVVVIFR